MTIRQQVMVLYTSSWALDSRVVARIFTMVLVPGEIWRVDSDQSPYQTGLDRADMIKIDFFLEPFGDILSTIIKSQED